MALLTPLRRPESPAPGKGVHLRGLVPDQLGGWQVNDLPLGETEMIQGEVARTLRYDDVLFREYRQGGRSILLFVAYWNPASMPIQLVASHTPDRCWSEAGWVCEQQQHDQFLPGAKSALKKGEWRVFTAPGGTRLHVHYWHLVGDTTYDFGQRFNRMPSAWRWWRDATKQIFRAPPEQYFIRISSTGPFEELEADPGWQEIVAALGRLGLAAKSLQPAG